MSDRNSSNPDGVSLETGKRFADYVGNWLVDVLLIPVFAALLGLGWWLLADQLTIAVGDYLAALLIGYVVATPLYLEIRGALQGDRPAPPYTKAAYLVGELLARTLAGAVAVGVVAGNHAVGAGLGALCGLLTAAVSLAVARPWAFRMPDEQRAEFAARLRDPDFDQD